MANPDAVALNGNAAPVASLTHGMAPASIGVDEVVKRFGHVDVLRHVSLDVTDGEIVALLGPSGCGKTTLLRSIAGLERIDGGSIEIDGTAVSSAKTHHAPETRHIGMVFQDWALFPHLTVGQNVAYGLNRKERRAGLADDALAIVGLDALADRLPATLSGGQQQRVALARALAPRPRAILLDEPFSNLDTTLRAQVRTEVHRLLSELDMTTIFVTHDQEEAFVLGDRVAVMNAGVIEQHAAPNEVYESPATRWIADFVGEANLLAGDGRGDCADTAIGRVPLRNHHQGPTDVLVRPEDVVLAPGEHAEVELVEYYGHDHVTIVRLADGYRLRCRAAGVPRFHRGQRVRVSSSGAPSVAFDADRSFRSDS